MNEPSTSTSCGPLGFLGGAFDPVHTGHLRGALAARESLGLECVDLIPAAQSPLKSASTVDAGHRLAMLQLAVANVSGLGVDARELDRPGPSYTIDTLAELRRDWGQGRSLFWLIGSDNLCTLPKWARWQDLLDFAHRAVLDRPGASPPPPVVAEWLVHHEADVAAATSRPAGKVVRLQQPLLDIASSAIRAMIAEGRDPRFLMPDVVMEYIEAHDLFARSSA